MSTSQRDNWLCAHWSDIKDWNIFSVSTEILHQSKIVCKYQKFTPLENTNVAGVNCHWKINTILGSSLLWFQVDQMGTQ